MSLLVDLKRQLKEKNDQIIELRSQLTVKDKLVNELQNDLERLRTGYSKFVESNQKKERCVAISAEPPRTESDLEQLKVQRHSKSNKSRETIIKAIQKNDFLKHLDADRIEEIVSCMTPQEVAKDTWIITEGETCSVAYVLEDGKVEVTKNGRKFMELDKETVFGELAMLYNCTRTAGVKAVIKCKLWAIDRASYQNIMTSSAVRHLRHRIAFLKSVEQIKVLPEENISNIADALDKMHYDNGDCIVRKGEKGDTFYIISKGKVKITETDDKIDVFKGEGECFGERALEGEDKRTATVYACHPTGVECLVLERSDYVKFIGRLPRSSSSSENQVAGVTESMKNLSTGEDTRLASIKLSDLKVLSTLGIGGFGRVELVQVGADASKTFALKKMRKKYLVDTHQQGHVMNEKKILLETRCDFIVRLYRTFKDSKYLYLLSEACLVGELWSVLRDKGPFSDSTSRFYTGCVVEAFTYLHSKSLVYRDLKPENLLLDRTGYVKLVDFGFAKFIGNKGEKTYTFCGTPEYIAPEIILNKGHDFGSDLWALGILIYELMNGSPPFTASDHMKTYNMILKGIDGIEFSKKISKHAKLLIKQLCRENPIERIGYGLTGLKQLRKHKWFDGFSWVGLQKRTLKAPIIPTVKDVTDAHNFDKFPTEVKDAVDDFSGWDKDF